MEKYSPIVLFGFVRLESIKKVIQGLLTNPEAGNSLLYIYIDGPRNERDIQAIESVYNYCSLISGFKKVEIKKSSTNKGLDPSIIDGVTEILNRHGFAIVLEDDVVPTSNFLSFMNSCLNLFESDERVMSICGWGVKISKPSNYNQDVYLFGRSSSWGWATWKNRWDSIDWKIKDWDSFRNNSREIRQFKKYGGGDMFSMLKKCMNGGNMWDIRFCYNMFRQKKYSVIPFLSKTDNVGYNEMAIHCKPVKYKRFSCDIDSTNQRNFCIDVEKLEPDRRIIRQRLKISSLYRRLITRIKNLLSV